MKCLACQSDNRDGVKFCEECGAQMELRCLSCGASIPPGRKFCGECGHKLTLPKAPAPLLDPSAPSSYTPKHLADKILTSKAALEGERKLVTVLFADVASYTSLSEKLDPEEVHQIMDGCFQILMAEIHRYEGTINQFTGDGVMALFGAPLAHEDHAQRACHAALSIQKAMSDYGERLKREYGLDFHLRIGLNSGPVVVGKIGDDLRMDYTAIGDTTNLASRLQSLASPGTILASFHTFRLVQDFFLFQSLGPVEVKGKEEPQEAYQLLKEGEVISRLAASVSKGLTRFIGRTKELQSLQEAYEKVKSGSGQVLGLVGEAGVGKSRLLWEFRQTLSPDSLYLEGRCLHFGESMPYLPILDLLRSYFDLREGDREHLIKRKMAERVSGRDEILSPLYGLLSLKVEDEAFSKLDPILKRDRTFEALRDLFLGQTHPLILAIEDLHWIDPTSQEFLDYLIGWLAKAKILLLLLYRPEYRHPWGSKSYYSKIGLDQLPLTQSAELVQALLEGGDVAPELKDLILTRAAGNPLFMEELTHTLLENGTIRKKDHLFTLTRSPSEIQVPDTIQGIIAARMDRLEENLKRTMQVASVIGRDFAFRVLQVITGMREELKSHLLNLQGLEFIYEKSLFPELEYIFKHALTQEVAYNSLLLKRRKEIHERIGKAIENLYGQRIEEFCEVLGYHYAKAENSPKACHYLKLSGQKAMRSFATHEAYRFYQEALELLKKQAETEKNRRDRLEILTLMMSPIRLSGYPEGCLEVLREGEELAQKMGDNRALAAFHSRMGHYFKVREGNPLLAIEYGEKCFQEAEVIGDIELIARVGLDLCSFYFDAGGYAQVVNLAPKFLTLLEDAGKEREVFAEGLNVYSATLSLYGRSLAMVGMRDFDAAKGILDKALSFALGMNDKASLVLIESQYGWLLLKKGDGRGSAEHFENAIGYAEEVKYLQLLGLAWTGLGEAHRLMGDLEVAREHMEKGLNIHKGAGFPWLLSAPFLYLGGLHFDSGDLDGAKDCLEQALRLSQQHYEWQMEILSRIWMGRTLAKADPSQAEEAEQNLLQGIRMAEERQLRVDAAWGYGFLGEFYANRGEKEKARETLKKAMSTFQELGMKYGPDLAQVALDQLGEDEK